MSVTKISSNFSEVLETKICYKIYEHTNHLGNVLTTISDRKLAYDDVTNGTGVDYFTADVVSYSDYYPFGREMDGRVSANGYRFGFNGKEVDSEFNNRRNHLDYGFRIYNGDLGRFLSVDPLFRSFPWYTPFQFAGNKPIWAVDLDGLEEAFANVKFDVKLNKHVAHISINPKAKPEDAGKVQYFYPDGTSEPIRDLNEKELKYLNSLKEKQAKENREKSSTKTLSIGMPLENTNADENQEIVENAAASGKATTKPKEVIVDGKKVQSGASFVFSPESEDPSGDESGNITDYVEKSRAILPKEVVNYIKNIAQGITNNPDIKSVELSFTTVTGKITTDQYVQVAANGQKVLRQVEEALKKAGVPDNVKIYVDTSSKIIQTDKTPKEISSKGADVGVKVKIN